MTLGPDRPWADATLRKFGPMPHRVGRARILEGRVRFQLPSQLVTYEAAKNLEHYGFATVREHGVECFSCTLTTYGEEELDRLLFAEGLATEART